MPEEILSDVYDITVRTLDDGSRYRVFCFDGEEPTLVDAGFEDSVGEVTTALDELGVTPTRLVVTHGDPDHVGGVAGLADRYDLETWVPEGVEFDGPDPDHRYGDGDRVGRFVAVHTPGHTPHHHSLVDEDGGVAVIGDAVFGSDVRGLPEGYFVLPPAYYSTDVGAADESLERFLDYEFDAGLVYHGTSVTEGASEKLSQFVEFSGKL